MFWEVAMLFEKFFKDITGGTPLGYGVDVYSLYGLSMKRWLELARLLDKKCVVLRDNDGEEQSVVKEHYSEYLSSKLKMFVSCKDDGRSLEEQIVSANGDDVLRKALKRDGTREELLDWMKKHKTETALRLLESNIDLRPPRYFTDAIKFINAQE